MSQGSRAASSTTEIVRGLAEPIAADLGMEVVEVAPPYDVSDMTAQLACRAVMDVLGTLVAEGKLGRRAQAEARARAEDPPAPASA